MIQGVIVVPDKANTLIVKYRVSVKYSGMNMSFCIGQNMKITTFL